MRTLKNCQKLTSLQIFCILFHLLTLLSWHISALLSFYWLAVLLGHLLADISRNLLTQLPWNLDGTEEEISISEGSDITRNPGFGLSNKAGCWTKIFFNFCQFLATFDYFFQSGALWRCCETLIKIIKYGKTLAKNKEKPCSTCIYTPIFMLILFTRKSDFGYTICH